MLNVYLLRHGQTAWNADNNRYCGRTDIPLTEKGTAQAEDVQRQLQSISFAAVYSSPLQRAVQTARIVSRGSEVIPDQRLIEADFGGWEGKCKEEFIPEDPQRWKDWCTDPSGVQAGGTGETGIQVVERVSEFFVRLQGVHSSGNILVVAHNAVNRLYLSYKLGMPLKNYRKLFFENSAVSMFEMDAAGELTLMLLNSKGV